MSQSISVLISGKGAKCLFFAVPLKNSLKIIFFLGVEPVPGMWNTKGLRFVRMVDSDKGTYGGAVENQIFDSAFTEDVWFVKGKGMVYLQQKVEGKVSMTWTLVEFEG